MNVHPSPGNWRDRSRALADARAEDCRRRLLAGETLQSIANSYGLCRERIRQIVSQMGVVNPRHALAEKRKKEREESLRQHKAEVKARHARRAAIIDTVRGLVEGGMSINAARKSLGLSRTFGNNLVGIGMPTRYGRWRTDLPEIRKRAVALWQAGTMSKRAIAEELGTTITIVRTALNLAGEDALERRGGRPGPRDPERAARIASAYAAGEPAGSIAKREGVHEKSVYRIAGRASVRRQGVPRPRKEVLPIAPAKGSVWTEEALEALSRGWSEGQTAAQIAASLGPPFTRSSVLGRIFRLRRGKGRG